uniref:Uncharacterized protein n=1 Tax=Cafileria marina TaxID=2557541 RepID=A0A5B9IRN7_9STRA|nr:hypothetical protein [Cafileria marina]QEF30276.1 hypothetical protein [Cafileria marina]
MSQYSKLVDTLNFNLNIYTKNKTLNDQKDFVNFFFKKGLKKKSINLLNQFAWKNTRKLNNKKYHNLNLLMKYNTFFIDNKNSNKKWKKNSLLKVVPIKLNIQKKKKIYNIINEFKHKKVNDNFLNIYTKNIINFDKDFWKKQFINYHQPLCSRLQQQSKYKKTRQDFIKNMKNKLKYKKVYDLNELQHKLKSNPLNN